MKLNVGQMFVEQMFSDQKMWDQLTVSKEENDILIHFALSLGTNVIKVFYFMS